jgi:HSP20 family protein
MYRRLRIPSIWREMDQLQREMNCLMDSSFGRRAFGSPSFPAINIWTSEDGQIITAELPGFDPKDIDIDVNADKLTLSGERKFEDVKEGVRYHRQERSYGKFIRSIQLPFMVDTTKVDASMKDGVLEIALRRAEADKSKKITVKSG